MKKMVYPLPLDAVLARQVSLAAEQSGLSRAELMRQAIAFGLPTVVKALGKAPQRITNINPLSARHAKALYQEEDDDLREVHQRMAHQRFEVAD